MCNRFFETDFMMLNRKRNREKEVKFYDILYQMTLHPRISLLQENKIIYKGSKEKKCYDISYHDVTIKITKKNKIHKDRGKVRSKMKIKQVDNIC